MSGKTIKAGASHTEIKTAACFQPELAENKLLMFYKLYEKSASLRRLHAFKIAYMESLRRLHAFKIAYRESLRRLHVFQIPYMEAFG